MKLIDYVIENDNKIPRLKKSGDTLGMDIETFLVEGYCPIGFHCLDKTIYAKPTYPRKDDKTDCKYRYDDDFDKCKECWNREIL